MASVPPADYADALIQAVNSQDGTLLAQLFQLGAFTRQPSPTLSDAVLPQLRDAQPQRIQSALVRCRGFLASPWTEIATHQLVVTHRLAQLTSNTPGSLSQSHGRRALKPEARVLSDLQGATVLQYTLEAWEALNALVVAFLRWFSSLQNGRWSLPALTTILSNHRRVSVLADDLSLQSTSSASSSTSKQQKHLEECARHLNKAFSACVADRSTDDATSRKWATYEVVGLVFRGYFKLKTLGLCRNILRALGAADIPPLDRFPMAQQVTFKYYTGVLAFLGEEYAKAEADLSFAFSHSHRAARHNQGMILQYLIPCRMLRGTLPSAKLLATFPQLARLYSPLVTAVRKGDVQSYDACLGEPEIERFLVQRGTFLALERAREVCLRGLLKRVYRCKDKSSRIALQDFHTALRFVGVQVELLETEWLVATQIAKGYVRGYISHGHQMTVLSAQNPFPLLQSVPLG